MSDDTAPQTVPGGFDPLADAIDLDKGAPTDGAVHVRVQQRNGRKSLTTVQGLPTDYDKKKILKALKKDFCCNGTVVEDPELGQVIQLQGDQRKNVSTFLVQVRACCGWGVRGCGPDGAVAGLPEACVGGTCLDSKLFLSRPPAVCAVFHLLLRFVLGQSELFWMVLTLLLTPPNSLRVHLEINCCAGPATAAFIAFNDVAMCLPRKCCCWCSTITMN